MRLEPLTAEIVAEVRELVKNSGYPNLFNRYLAMACWLEYRPIQVLRSDDWLMLVGVGDDIQLMRPLGVYTKQDMDYAISFMKKEHPGKPLWVCSLDDVSVDYFDKSLLANIEVAYVYDAKAIAQQQSKQLRNAVSRVMKYNIREETLTAAHRSDAMHVLHTWGTNERDSDTVFQTHLFDEFLEQQDDPGHGIVVYVNGEPEGVLYLVQDAAFPEYALVLVNTCIKNAKGISEYLLWRAGLYAYETWNCKYINYGGVDPKADSGLHFFKKKFGWDHVLMEYGILYKPEDPSPTIVNTSQDL